MTTFVMDMMHQSGEAGMAAMPEFWLLKLDAQRYDLRIYADEHRVRQADQTLLTGDIVLVSLTAAAAGAVWEPACLAHL